MQRRQQTLLSFYNDQKDIQKDFELEEFMAECRKEKAENFNKASGNKSSFQECVQASRRPQASHSSSVPGIKRIHENEGEAFKRAKLMKLLEADEGLQRGESCDEISAKFEWLEASKIRDGKGRRPIDPFFDRRTVKIPPDVLHKMTASQKQYWETKSQYMDTVLFFKVGKFYELYELDADIGHKELNWKVTTSGVGKCRQVGVPESGIEDAVQKLLSLGYKVGRMEQMETATEAKAKRGSSAMVQRKLVHVLTPSTVMDENLKPDAVHLLALYENKPDLVDNLRLNSDPEVSTVFGFAFVDAAAGRFYVGSLLDDSSCTALGALLTQVGPRELLYPIGGLSRETQHALRRYSAQGFLQLELTPMQPNGEFMESSDAISMINSRGYFKANPGKRAQDDRGVMTWRDALNAVHDSDHAASALGALVLHLCRIKLDEDLLKNGTVVPYEVYKGSLRLDGQTLTNLEILRNNANGGRAGTLLSYLDGCVTPFGKRLLRRWICHPLQSIGDINDRLDAVDELLLRRDFADALRKEMRQLPDLERLLARVRGLFGYSELPTVPILGIQIQQKVRLFCSLVKGLCHAFEILAFLYKGDSEGPPCSQLLQTASLLSDLDEAHDLLQKIEQYIDEKLPSINAQKDKRLQYDLNDNVMEDLNQYIVSFNQHNDCLRLVTETLGSIDVLVSFATASRGATGPTCRPHFVPKPCDGLESSLKGGSILSVEGLWHPFATGAQGGTVVPNDVNLGNQPDARRAMLLTGPNMGGKSTLLRATCLAVILSQLGSHVPAVSCTLSPVDIMFTRLGATDRILYGESTFLVECMEAASVLRHATRNSLVVLDELGRGTSTFDGYAIAYAVFRHLVDTLDCRLLFATHYFPLTKEFAAHPSVSLQHMAFTFESHKNDKETKMEHVEDSIHDAEKNLHPSVVSDKQLIFLYKLTSGPCSGSYGLQVALLAGLPRSVVNVAEVAADRMRTQLSTAFMSCDYRENFSHLHEKWLKAILALANSSNTDPLSDNVDYDAYDMLLCLWHELQMLQKKL